MREKMALRIMLVMGGNYDLPGQTVTVHGFDAFGHPVVEQIPVVDMERLERDLENQSRIRDRPSLQGG